MSSRAISASSSFTPAGMPSTMPRSASPCESPAVRKRILMSVHLAPVARIRLREFLHGLRHLLHIEGLVRPDAKTLRGLRNQKRESAEGGGAGALRRLEKERAPGLVHKI